MGSKPVMITGEASETDSDGEDETNFKTKKRMAQSVQGAVVTGEDSESENENDASISSAVSALNQSNVKDKLGAENKHGSLLHQKLKEYNTRLYNDMENLCQNTINDAGKNLSTIDQQLLRSQLTLQSAVTSIKSLSVNSLTIKNRLHFLLSAKFFPNIKINK